MAWALFTSVVCAFACISGMGAARIKRRQTERSFRRHACAAEQVGSWQGKTSQERTEEICSKVAEDVNLECAEAYPEGLITSSRRPCCELLKGALGAANVSTYFAICPKRFFTSYMFDEPVQQDDVSTSSETQPDQRDPTVAARQDLCIHLNGHDSLSGVRVQLDSLRKEEKMPNGRTVHEQLYRSFSCDDFESLTPLQSIRATGQSASAAMKTNDGLFRLKELLPGEYDFWLQEAGAALVRHWQYHAQSAMAKYYAIVNSNTKSKPRYWVIMRNAFAGISDVKSDTYARIYDLKGSGRFCRWEGCGTTREAGEVNFDLDFPNGLGLFEGWFRASSESEQGFSGAFRDFFQALYIDAKLLQGLHIHDYSLVVRVTPTAPMCPDNLKDWNDAPVWQGPGSEFCAFAGLESVRITAVLLDYLQDSTTIHNRFASALPGSKIESDAYFLRFIKFMRKSFRPLVVMERLSGNAMDAVLNGYVSIYDEEDDTQDSRVCTPTSTFIEDLDKNLGNFMYSSRKDYPVALKLLKEECHKTFG